MTKIKRTSIEETYPEDAPDGNFQLSVSLVGNMDELLAVQNAVLSMVGHGAVVVNNTAIFSDTRPHNGDRVIEAFDKALDRVTEKRTVTIGLVTPECTTDVVYTAVEPAKAEVDKVADEVFGKSPVIQTSPIPHIAQESKVAYDNAVKAEEPAVTNVVSEPQPEAEQPLWAVDAFEAMTLAEVIRQALKGHNSSKEEAISWCLSNAERIAILSVVPADKRRARLARAAEVVL